MNEFIKKLIERLEERKSYIMSDFVLKDVALSVKENALGRVDELGGAIEIVNQLAEEYNNESVKGKWINTAPSSRSDNIVCSECGYNSIADYPFCPNCGRRMKDGVEAKAYNESVKGDLISRGALLDWINGQREEVTKKQVAGSDGIFTREVLVTMQRCIGTFETAINSQPTAYNDGWIPVSSGKLPDTKVVMADCNTCKYAKRLNHVCDECIQYEMYEKKITTNADRIRAMSNEELAEFLVHVETMGYHDQSISGTLEMIDWLQSEMEEQK